MSQLTFIFYFLLNDLFLRVNSFLCGDRQIDNCKKCGKGDESNNCALCKDNYFLLLDNSLCLSCNDPIYGQEGCNGSCTYKLDNIYLLYVRCNDCKEGYFNKNGICLKCDYNFPGCSECSYDSEKYEFNCLKCSNEEGYRFDSNSKCVRCENYLPNCKKCHFVDDEGIESECDECLDGYYLYQKNCSSCKNISIEGGYCSSCSNDDSDLKSDNCYCDPGYVLEGTSCFACPNNCDKCKYNKDINSTTCLRCKAGFALDKNQECIKCVLYGCRYCTIDENSNQICLDCGENKYILEEKKCYTMDDCIEFEYDKTKNNIICLECSLNLIYDIENHECTTDSFYSDHCYATYDYSLQKFKCKSCYSEFIYLAGSFQYLHLYCLIKNTVLCLPNTDPKQIGLYGCEIAESKGLDKYECLKCKNYNFESFIKINENNFTFCEEISKTNLSSDCLEAERIGSNYSCLKCDEEYALVEDTNTKLKNCFFKKNNLSYCLEGKFENGEYTCIKSANNTSLKDNKYSCNSGYFSYENNWCYKCNDPEVGNSGCDETGECSFLYQYSGLNCSKCVEGYFKNNESQCVLYSNYINNCNKCHYDTIKSTIICDSSISSVYILNTNENECQLNNCQEYPEISPGCIICDDKLDDYKNNNRCQRCKYGYFKTKDEQCIYCSSEKYGGIGCHECGYEINEQGLETDNIICKECFSDLNINEKNLAILNENEKSPLLSKSGKCYDCNIQFAGTCKKCKLIEETQTLKCISCLDGYNLTQEGNCINLFSLIPKIKNCKELMFSSENIRFKYITNDDNPEFKIYNYSNYSNNEFISEFIYSNGLEGFTKKCLICIEGYFLNEEGNCEKLTYDSCSFNSIMNNFNILKVICYNLCSSVDNVKIILKLSKEIDYQVDNFTFDNSSRYVDFINLFDYFDELGDILSCMSNSGKGGKYAPKNLKNCKEAYYFPENKTYTCICDIYDYNKKTNICKPDKCTFVNIGTEIKPRYKCFINGYYINDFVLVTYENGQKQYLSSVYELEGCVEAIANTTYPGTKYNCTKCSFKYVPYYSDFYESIICQDVTRIIEREKNYYVYHNSLDETEAVNGVCEKDFLFTYDNEYCYKCDDMWKGMPGCKGGCDFSNKRENSLKCTGTCKKGYIEYSEGICEKCSYINSGCYECHYETDEYFNNYEGIIKKLDYCKEKYILTSAGECELNIDLDLNNCLRGKVDPNNNDTYICEKCEEDYFINEKGKCEKCDAYHFRGKNRCIECTNTSEGGIENCLYCVLNKEKAICQKCLPGYIISTIDNTCLSIAKNKELQGFANCEQLTKENDKYICARCKYTLYVEMQRTFEYNG